MKFDAAGPAGAAGKLYGRAAMAMNSFFGRYTSLHCSGCLELHKRFNPDDPIALNSLHSGYFPGCCQAGVDEDYRIPDSCGGKLPVGLVMYIERKRTFIGQAAVSDYEVRDHSTGKIHAGKGCKWLGEGGCLLGNWKSPICLTYLCQPVRSALLLAHPDPALFSGEDFLGFIGVLRSISGVCDGGEEGLIRARGEVRNLILRIRAVSSLLSLHQ